MSYIELASQIENCDSHPSAIALPRAIIEDTRLTFDTKNGFDQAFRLGFFLLEIPDRLDLGPADMMAQSFYKTTHAPHDEFYRKSFRELTGEIYGDPLLGFHQRKDQIEQFLLERRFWASSFKRELYELGDVLTMLSATVVRAVLAYADIPPALWKQASGGCSNAEGAYHFTFNHYRSDLPTRGLNAHRDDGFITMLRSLRPGLQIFQNETWCDLPAEPKCFKVNFGLAMQMLTEEAANPVTAVEHRVVQQKNDDRWSWGLFASSKFGTEFDSGIFTYQTDGSLRYVEDARHLINRNDDSIYR
jgi:hypothetical protein